MKSTGLLPCSSVGVMLTDSRNYTRWLRLHQVRAMHKSKAAAQASVLNILHVHNKICIEYNKKSTVKEFNVTHVQIKHHSIYRNIASQLSRVHGRNQHPAHVV